MRKNFLDCGDSVVVSNGTWFRGWEGFVTTFTASQGRRAVWVTLIRDANGGGVNCPQDFHPKHLKLVARFKLK